MKEKLIYGQCNSPIAQLCYGRTRQTVAKTGCGAVAVYNALVLSGKNAVFEDVLREMERLRMPWMFGLFGTKPFALRRYFRKNNIYSIIYIYEDFSIEILFRSYRDQFILEFKFSKFF